MTTATTKLITETIESIQDKLYLVGHYAQRRELIAYKWMLKAKRGNGGGVKAMLIEGAPGTGKTHGAESFGKAFGLETITYMCHAWTSDDEFYKTINVEAVVANDVSNITERGVLARAALMSMTARTLLILDEVDKTEDRTQNLLLDFLQTGRVPSGPGQHIQANLDNLHVILLSNATKLMSPALIRRNRRWEAQHLPREVQAKVIAATTGVDSQAVMQILEVCYKAAEMDRRDVTLQELSNCIDELIEVTECAHDVAEIIAAWCLRTSKNVKEVEKICGDLHPIILDAIETRKTA